MVNTDHTRQLQSNFTVMLTNNVGFQVAEHAHGLQLDVMMPSTGFVSINVTTVKHVVVFICIKQPLSLN